MTNFINWAGRRNLGDDAMDAILHSEFGEIDWDIFGGGTLISPSGEFYDKITRPEQTIGISLGVADSWEGQGTEVLKRLHKIYTRDIYSHIRLNDYSIENTLSVDLLCYLQPKGEKGKGKKFANLLFKTESFPLFNKVIKEIDISGYEPFALSQDHDLWAMPGAKVYDDAQELLDTLNGADHIIATRLHANVLAWMTGARVTPIVYDQKIAHFYQRVATLTPKDANNIIKGHLQEIINA